MTTLVNFSEAVEDASRGNSKLPQGSFLPEGPFPVVDQGQRLVAGYSDDASLLCKVPAPVIVFGDHTRSLKYIDFPFVMGADGVKVLRVREGWDPKFVFHYLRFCDIPSAGYSRHFKFLKDVCVPKPLLEEQRRIATILDQADALRAKRRQALAHLDDLTQSIFHDMFSGAARSIRLGDLAGFYSGGTPSKAKPKYWEGELPWFSAKDLKADNLADSQDHISKRVLAETSLRLLPADTITLVVRGMILAHTLPISVLRVPGTINQDLKAVLPRQDVSVDFLAAAMRARAGWVLARVSTAAHGTKKLDSSVLESVPIPDVSAQCQHAFASSVERLDTVRHLARGSAAIADELFASLQARAFNGEL